MQLKKRKTIKRRKTKTKKNHKKNRYKSNKLRGGETINEDECSVCYTHENIEHLPCHHNICKNCIKGMVDANPSRNQYPCPMCRNNLPQHLTNQFKISAPVFFLNKIANISRWNEWEYEVGYDPDEYSFKLTGSVNDVQRNNIQRALQRQIINITEQQASEMGLRYNKYTVQMMKMRGSWYAEVLPSD